MVNQEKEMLENKHNHAVAAISFRMKLLFKSSIPPKDADHNHHVIRGTRPHLNLPIYMAPWDM
jgi:hypothetical protein